MGCYHLSLVETNGTIEFMRTFFSPAVAFFQLICNDVRLRISSFQKVVDNPENRSMCERWSFRLNILGHGGISW